MEFRSVARFCVALHGVAWMGGRMAVLVLSDDGEWVGDGDLVLCAVLQGARLDEICHFCLAPQPFHVCLLHPSCLQPSLHYQHTMRNTDSLRYQ